MPAHLNIAIGDDDRRRDRLEALLRPSTEKCKFVELNKMNLNLYSAAKKADVDAFIGALEDYSNGEGLSDIFYQLSPGENTLLHVAATNSQDDMVRAIIDFFPRELVSRENSQGDTALHIAARAGAIETLKLIVRHGGSLRARNTSGNTPLHEAVRNMHYQLIEHLVTAETLCAQNRQGKSPLYLAVETGELEVLKHLLRAPIDGEATTKIEGMSPVHAAIMHQKKKMMEEMWSNKPWLFQLKDAGNGTPLHLASYSNYLDGVKFLIEKLPTSAFEYDSDGNLPIHIACNMGHLRVIEELLQQWPDPTEFRTIHGQNILHVSAKHGTTAAVKYILENLRLEKLINEKDGSGNSALHLAAMNWEPAALLLLARDERVDVEVVNVDNLTALDLVEDNMRGIDVTLRQRLTQIILASAGTPKSRDIAICKATGRDLPKNLEPRELDRLKEAANTQMVVATLVATMTFAAGFTVPGGFSGSQQDAGMSILLNKALFQVFLICDTIAMYCAVITAALLLWVQVNDLRTVRNILHHVRLLLLLSLSTMSVAFMAGIYVTTSKLLWLSILILIEGICALYFISCTCVILWTPLGSTSPFLGCAADTMIVMTMVMAGICAKEIHPFSSRVVNSLDWRRRRRRHLKAGSKSTASNSPSN